MLNTIDEAIKDIQEGKMIVVIDDPDRENEGDLVCAAKYATPEIVNFMATHAKGLICMPMSEEMVNKLGLKQMVEKNTDNHETAFTVSIDYIDTDTGISAFERSKTAIKTVDINVKPEDFRKPGHMFPLLAKKGGVLKRPGHTEATVDILRLAKLPESGLCCEIMNDDGTMMRTNDLLKFAKKHGLKVISIKSLIDHLKANEKFIKREVETVIPTKYGIFKIFGYTDTLTNESHVALVMGNPEKIAAPVRVHSECLTGDTFGSEKCDCGNQLDTSMKIISKEKSGALIYLRQEGRGIGIINKLKAYKLQEDGLDTVEANIALGFPADLRDYCIAAQILKDLNISNVKLITNNPDKISDLKKYGINVEERIPIETEYTKFSKKYMQTKKLKLGHILHI